MLIFGLFLCFQHSNMLSVPQLTNISRDDDKVFINFINGISFFFFLFRLENFLCELRANKIFVKLFPYSLSPLIICNLFWYFLLGLYLFFVGSFFFSVDWFAWSWWNGLFNWFHLWIEFQPSFFNQVFEFFIFLNFKGRSTLLSSLILKTYSSTCLSVMAIMPLSTYESFGLRNL